MSLLTWTMKSQKRLRSIGSRNGTKRLRTLPLSVRHQLRTPLAAAQRLLQEHAFVQLGPSTACNLAAIPVADRQPPMSRKIQSAGLFVIVRSVASLRAAPFFDPSALAVFHHDHTAPLCVSIIILRAVFAPHSFLDLWTRGETEAPCGRHESCKRETNEEWTTHPTSPARRVDRAQVRESRSMAEDYGWQRAR